jgi:hypothetical protein
VTEDLYDNTPEGLERLAEAIRTGMDVMQISKAAENRTPLAIAALKGNLEACRLLLNAGADPNKSRGWQNGPSTICEVINSAAGRNFLGGEPVSKLPLKQARAIIKLLVEYGASPDGRPVEAPAAYRESYASPIHLAVEKGSHELVALLAEFNADLNANALVSDVGGIPTDPLGTAKAVGDQAMMVTLLRHGADDQFLGSATKGYSPFIGTVITGYDKVAEYYVRERGEDLAQRFDGRTLLQLAKTPIMRTMLRALKTEMAVKDVLDSSTKLSRSAASQSIIQEFPKRNGVSRLSPL